MRNIRSAFLGESPDHQIVITIDPCNLHSTTAARPAPANPPVNPTAPANAPVNPSTPANTLSMLRHEDAFLDRLTTDNVETQKDALMIARELLSLPNTRIDLLNLHQEDSSKALKPLPSYSL